MYVEKPRRLLSILLLLVLLLVGAWFVFLRGSSSTPSAGAPPVVAQIPPAVVQTLDATAAQPRVVIIQSGSGIVFTHYVDAATDSDAYLDNGKLVSLQKGKEVWSDNGSCYTRVVDEAPVTVKELVGQYLPVGGSSIGYTYPQTNEIAWTITPAPGAHFKPPHGLVVFATKTHLLLSAITYTPVGAPVHVTLSYPTHARAFATPTRICTSKQLKLTTHAPTRPPLKKK